MYKHKKFNDEFSSYLPKMTKPPVKMKDILSKRKAQQKEHHESIQYRNDILNAVKRQNYINEYDRIKAELSHNITHGHVSHATLTARQKRLKELFAESFEDVLHEINDK